MNKRRRNAVMITALSLLFGSLQLAKSIEQLTIYSLILSLIIPVIGVIFALNETDKKWRWSLIILNIIVFIMMAFMLFTILSV